MAKLSPVFVEAQFIDGIPANGAKLFTYVAGSSTKQATYTDEAGLTAQPNPILLNSRGEPAQPIWLTEGLSYKFVFAPATDSDPPVSPIRTIDNITGVNDASLTIDQWVDSGFVPTYVSPTVFTVPGDQTSAFQVNRRVKLLVTAGTVYGYISASAFAALTTVTVVLDSGVLDSGLSSVQLGLITPTNTSLFLMQTSNIADNAVTSAKIADNAVTSAKIANANVTLAKLENAAKTSKIQRVTASVSANALTVAIHPTVLDFRSPTLADGSPITRELTAVVWLTVPNTATLGTINAIPARLAILAIDNAGTIEAAIVNLAGGNILDETMLISTTALSTASNTANVIYSPTARTNVTYRVVGFVESTQATAGTWATAPTLVQGAGGEALKRVLPVKSMVRLNTSNGYGSTNTTILRFSNVVTNQGGDITYADSATLGASFNINNSGVYAISAVYQNAGAGGAFGLSVNSTQLTTNIASITAADRLCLASCGASNSLDLNPSCTVYLTAGSVVRPHADGNGTSAAGRAAFTITRVA